jgi:hypothetical protein
MKYSQAQRGGPVGAVLVPVARLIGVPDATVRVWLMRRAIKCLDVEW